MLRIGVRKSGFVPELPFVVEDHVPALATVHGQLLSYGKQGHIAHVLEADIIVEIFVEIFAFGGEALTLLDLRKGAYQILGRFRQEKR